MTSPACEEMTYTSYTQHGFLYHGRTDDSTEFMHSFATAVQACRRPSLVTAFQQRPDKIIVASQRASEARTYTRQTCMRDPIRSADQQQIYLR